MFEDGKWNCSYCPQWEALTLDGNLCAKSPDGTTVGQLMCDTLSAKGRDNIGPHTVSFSVPRLLGSVVSLDFGAFGT